MNAKTALLLVVLIFPAVPASAQVFGSAFQTKRSVMCVEFVLSPPENTTFGFAKATLVSLWYARNAQQRASEITKQAKTDTSTFLASAASIEKIVRNEYFCSQEMLTTFTISSDANIKTAAEALEAIYNAHIKLTDREVQLANATSQADPAEFLNKIGALEAERSHQWAGLDTAVARASTALADHTHAAVPGKADRLALTKAQKQQLLSWVEQHFPELKNPTPKEQLADPARSVQTYLKMLAGRKCADE